MPLRWLIGDNVADGGTFLPPKTLTLEAYSMEQAPSLFDVFQLHESALRQILKAIGVSARTRLAQFGVVAAPGGPYRSDRMWDLPLPRGALRRSSAFAFSAGASPELSGTVYAARKARSDVHREATLGFQLPGVPVKAGVGTKIVYSNKFAVDPVMQVRVVTGAQLAQHMLALLDDVASSADEEFSDARSRVALERGDLEDQLHEIYTPPPDWDARVPPSITGSPEADTTSTLEIRATSRGIGYFALRLSDDDGPEAEETSSVCAVSVNSELEATLILDLEDFPLPLAALA